MKASDAHAKFRSGSSPSNWAASRSPSANFYRFFRGWEGSPKIDYRKKTVGALIRTSLLEDLALRQVKPGSLKYMLITLGQLLGGYSQHQPPFGGEFGPVRS